ncbi:Methyltransferase [Desulfosarcina cetonica]|uniref:class I SAM-dependent methyltransferase n=1 Tax=Desulfosarcina cetonica TaxID=90730 RepID=UPI0006D05DAF|nr:class I SAM-dependent methyltransferase [Desulfosarcina cetonica]VTR71087.1 Methyltransferase [Desulfosarcina cetonica]
MLSNGRHSLSPVYPLIAQQIVDDYQVTCGTCIDIGTGPGHIGIELAKITDLTIYFVDLKPEALSKAKHRVAECGLNNAAHFVEADVCQLPFCEHFADLVVSRGSLWFWHDQVKGLQEIHRILKPGAIAFVGGGLGRYTPASMRKRLKGLGRKMMEKHGGAKFLKGAELGQLLGETGLNGCRLVTDVNDQPATWIEMHKS